MKEKILEIIRKLQEEREKAHIVPPLVLTSEIVNHGCHNPYSAINELVREGRLNWHKTINQIAFTINK